MPPYFNAIINAYIFISLACPNSISSYNVSDPIRSNISSFKFHTNEFPNIGSYNISIVFISVCYSINKPFTRTFCVQTNERSEQRANT